MSHTTMVLPRVHEPPRAVASPPLAAANPHDSASIAFLFTTYGLVILTWCAAIALAMSSR